MKIKNQITRLILSSLFLAVLGFSAGQEISARSETPIEKLISQSCQGLENCENEGKILHLQGQPLNKIIQSMCGLQFNVADQSDCYNFAYRLAPRLGKSEILRGYERNFSLPLVKGYLHFVSRTCQRFVCLAGELRCEVRANSCWQKLTTNLETEIEGILQDMAARKQG